MRYAFLKMEDLTSAAFRGCEPVDRATWLCLLTWCYEQENGGRIVGARAWGDRRWQQTLAVTKEETGHACDLWWWDGDDLVVAFYDADYVAGVHASSRQGAAGGRATSEAKAQAARDNGARGGRRQEPNTEPNKNPTPNPTEPNTENPREPNEPKPVCLSVSLSSTAAAAASPDGHRRKAGIDQRAVGEAVNAGDLAGVVEAFGGESPDSPTWARDAGGLAIAAVATILGWRAGKGDPVRFPSGMRKAREAWKALAPGDRLSLAMDAAERFGFPPPEPPEAKAVAS